MRSIDYVINLLLSLMLIVGVYQFYFWCQRNPLAPARQLGTQVDECIPYRPGWVWVYSGLYYPLLLYLNLVFDSPRQFTHVAASYLLLLFTQMAFFLLFPVNLGEHDRALTRCRDHKRRHLDERDGIDQAEPVQQ